MAIAKGIFNSMSLSILGNGMIQKFLRFKIERDSQTNRQLNKQLWTESPGKIYMFERLAVLGKLDGTKVSSI